MKMFKKLYGKTVINASDNEGINKDIILGYYITKSGLYYNRKYGVAVEKSQIGNEVTKVECQELNNIFNHKKEANNILGLLLTNKVTPIGLNDVVEDLVGICVQ